MRYLVTWSAPYVVQGDNGESIGIYGVEGSKPGAPAVASFLHHTIVGLHKARIRRVVSATVMGV